MVNVSRNIFFKRDKTKNMKRVTIKDVAIKAGVSAAAVSRVFTNSAGSSSEMRKKVLTAAHTLGYRPSMLAKGLVGERTNLITLVSGRMSDPFDTIFLDRFSAALAGSNMRLLLATAANESSSNCDNNGFLHALDYQSDAVVVSAGTMSLAHSEACVKNGLPVILMGRVVEQKGVDCVVADNREGGRMAAELLTKTGCQNLIHLGRGGATYSDRERMEAFLKYAAQAGVEVASAAIRSTEDHQEVYRAAISLLSGKVKPDGIFCSSDTIAFAVIEAARSLGLSIPEELSIVGFNDIPQAGWRSFDLTTIDLSIDQCIATAMELLSRRLEQPGIEGKIVRIPVQPVLRGTTRNKNKG